MGGEEAKQGKELGSGGGRVGGKSCTLRAGPALQGQEFAWPGPQGLRKSSMTGSGAQGLGVRRPGPSACSLLPHPQDTRAPFQTLLCSRAYGTKQPKSINKG